jgi:hypothetical protein
MRTILFLLAALIGGPVLIVSGVREYQNSKKLAANGKTTNAAVVDAIETVTRKYRGHRYYLVVKYQPEGAQAYTKKLAVSHEAYDQGLAARTVQIHYLPSDPNIAQLGEKVEIRTGGMTTGALLLFGGLAVGAYLWVSRSRDEENSISDSIVPPVRSDLKKAA